jgi:hypothetical protein
MSTLTQDQLLAKTIYLQQENNRLREELLDAQVRLGLIALAPTEEPMSIDTEPIDPSAPQSTARVMSVDEAAEHFSNGEGE